MRRLIIISLLVWSFVTILMLVPALERDILYPDPDDVMRLQQVRDWMGGQSWFDLNQYRLVPSTSSMHWSRLIDAPLAGLILLFQLFLSPEQAELWATRLWPLIPLLLLLPAAGYIGQKLAVDGSLAGPVGGVAAIINTGLAGALISYFVPGRIDHHNVQMAGVMGLFALLCADPRRPLIAGLIGALSAVMLAIGMETLPVLILCGLVIVGLFIFDKNASPKSPFAYLLSFAALSTLIFLSTTPLDRPWLPSCDVLSPVYLGCLLISSVIMGLGMISPVVSLKYGRLMLVAGMGMASLFWVMIINQACLRGPYAEVNPALFPLWMDHVREAQSIIKVWSESLPVAVSVLTMPCLALIIAFGLARSQAPDVAQRGRMALLMLGLITMLSLWQARTLPFAALLAAPILSAGAVKWAERFNMSTLTTFALALVAANPFLITTSAGQAVGFFVQQPPSAKSSAKPEICTRFSNYETLKYQPKGLVLSHIAYGPYILATTRHHVVMAPYHRHDHGIVTGFSVLKSAPDQAERSIRALDIKYIALCREDSSLADSDGGRGTAHGSLGELLMRGEVPPWLAIFPKSPDQGMSFYLVLPNMSQD
jgi:uncharacterized membrane protein